MWLVFRDSPECDEVMRGYRDRLAGNAPRPQVRVQHLFRMQVYQG